MPDALPVKGGSVGMGMRVRARIRGLRAEDSSGGAAEDLYLHARRMAELLLMSPNFSIASW